MHVADEAPLLHRAGKHPSLISAIGFLVAALGVLAVATLVALQLIGHNSSLPEWTWHNWTGCVLFIFLSAPGLYLFGLYLIRLDQTAASSLVKAIGRFIFPFMLSGFGAVFTWILLIRTGRPFGPKKEDADTLRVLWGALIFSVCGVFCILSVYWFVRFLRKRPAALNAAAAATQPITRASITANAQNVSLLVMVLVVCFLFTMIFSPIWNEDQPDYFKMQSPYSLVKPLSAKFSFKIYADAVAYYTFLLAIVIMGFLSHTNQRVRRILLRRVKVGPAHQYNTLWEYGASIGELIVVTLWFCLLAYWVYYWGFVYKRIKQSTVGDPHANLQIAARVLGHVSTFTISFLLYPVTRNSLFESAFGVPFERAIRYHRFLGFLGVTAVTLHTIVWYAQWHANNLFANNFWTITDLSVGPVTNSTSGFLHYDNFTIPLNELSLIGVLVMFLIAMTLRRASYEVFLWTHQFFSVAFLLTALIHAWAFWYFSVGGLFLWGADKMLRLAKTTAVHSAADCKVLSAEHFGGITRIVFSGDAFQHEAGQYAFVNVPAASAFEWHPFSISSPPSAPFRSFHIRDMGEGTWTNALKRSVSGDDANEEFPLRATDAGLVMSVDGPYGRARPFSHRSILVLVAGGVGITPLMSVFLEVHNRLIANKRNPAEPSIAMLKEVHLIWVCPDSALFLWFADQLKAVMDTPIESTSFHLSLHRTGSSASRAPDEHPPGVSNAGVEWAQQRIIAGKRPDVGAYLAALRARHFELHSHDVLVMACGPDPLMRTTSEECFRQEVDFHNEEFYF